MVEGRAGEGWPDPAEYGTRFAAIDARLRVAFQQTEYHGRSADEVAELRYLLAKLAISAEDIRRAIDILEDGSSADDQRAAAVVELRNACGEVMDAFAAGNEGLISLLNFFSG